MSLESSNPNRIELPSAFDPGAVELVEVLGGDLSVVNAARASFRRRRAALGLKDIDLLDRLHELGHTSPGRHGVLQFVIDAPLMVARQWEKHRVASEHAFMTEEGNLVSVIEQVEVAMLFDPLKGWNELSYRYVTDRFKWYIPEQFLSARKDAGKYGAGGPVDPVLNEHYQDTLRGQIMNALVIYEAMLADDVVPQQARLVLPAFALQTRWVWTCSLEAAMYFVRLRKEEGAQTEIRQYADAIEALARQHFPHTWATYMKWAEVRDSAPQRIADLTSQLTAMTVELDRLRGLIVAAGLTVADPSEENPAA